MFDPDHVQQADLRGGTPPWQSASKRTIRPRVLQSFRCEVLVVGAGITGSLVAEHLASQGRDVCIIDRERPGYGSTAASTAMLQWEIDRPLGELADLYGFERAANVYRHSLAAVSGLVSLVAQRGVFCGMRERHSLYMAAGEVSARDLLAEHELRKKAGLPGDFLDARTIHSEFGFSCDGAILSPGSADADPLLMSQALLAAASIQGAKLFDGEAVSYQNSSDSVTVVLDDGHVIEAKHVVLATGYVMPDCVSSDLHKVASSWAIATPPQPPGSLWRDGLLLWEASKNYHYTRTTLQNRIVMGGEDDDQAVEPEARDALMGEKTKTLLRKLNELWPSADPVAEFVWSGAFGTTTDGLPLIGPVPGYPRMYAAYGYGGNGITFSYLASRMIGASIAGQAQPWFEDFAIDRSVSEKQS